MKKKKKKPKNHAFKKYLPREKFIFLQLVANFLEKYSEFMKKKQTNMPLTNICGEENSFFENQQSTQSQKNIHFWN